MGRIKGDNTTSKDEAGKRNNTTSHDEYNENEIKILIMIAVTLKSIQHQEIQQIEKINQCKIYDGKK